VSYAKSVAWTKKTKSGASSVSRGNTLEGTLCMEIMRLKIRATHEISQGVFLVIIGPWEQFQGKD